MIHTSDKATSSTGSMYVLQKASESQASDSQPVYLKVY